MPIPHLLGDLCSSEPLLPCPRTGSLALWHTGKVWEDSCFRKPSLPPSSVSRSHVCFTLLMPRHLTSPDIFLFISLSPVGPIELIKPQPSHFWYVHSPGKSGKAYYAALLLHWFSFGHSCYLASVPPPEPLSELPLEDFQVPAWCPELASWKLVPELQWIPLAHYQCVSQIAH